MVMNAQQIQALLKLVDEAGQQTLPFWRADVSVSSKADDSPVTAADMAAHRVLAAGLQQLTPNISVLSEEACEIPLAERQQWQRWWLVDPLDGTKEFIAGSEEFTVNVALIEAGQVVFGLVGVPTQNVIYYGGQNMGAWRVEQGKTHAISVAKPAQPLRVLASLRHSSLEQQQLMQRLQQETEIELLNAGSSLKFCWLAEGKADLYPRLAPTSQWDTAAAQAVLEGAGGEVIDEQGNSLTYVARESYLNPYFYALPKGSVWRDKIVNAVLPKRTD